jgi:hypothetical protein
MTFTERGLELGAQTLIVKARQDQWGRPTLDIDGHEPEILALLSVAHARPQPLSILANLRHASRSWSKGDLNLAYMHIALSGIQALPDADAPFRLFVADHLLKGGLSETDLLKTLDLLPPGLNALEWWVLAKYSPDQPRDDHGRWNEEGGGGSSAAGGIEQAAAQKDETHAKKERFVDAHLADAQKVADQLGVPVENILGLSAIESGWGGEAKSARLFRESNNFFSQHYPAPFATGYIWNEDHTVRFAIFSGYADSLKSFAAQYGHIVSGKRDPAEFAPALQNAGKYGINRNGSKVGTFVPDTSATIRGLRSVIARRSA